MQTKTKMQKKAKQNFQIAKMYMQKKKLVAICIVLQFKCPVFEVILFIIYI